VCRWYSRQRQPSGTRSSDSTPRGIHNTSMKVGGRVLADLLSLWAVPSQAPSAFSATVSFSSLPDRPIDICGRPW
jgi:hypothetical protein